MNLESLIHNLDSYSLVAPQPPVWIRPGQTVGETALLFTADGQVMLSRQGCLPSAESVEEQCGAEVWLRIGHIGTKPYVLLLHELSEQMIHRLEALQPVPVRQLMDRAEVQDIAAILRGRHLLNWHQRSAYCGRTGQPLSWCDDEIAKHGPDGRVYPRLSPAVIVAVTRGDQILLAQGVRHKGGFYSLIAGFVESGESIEQAVHREVAEETGLLIHNLEYLASQPWPFPDALMLGFRAEWKSGDISLNRNELLDAGWFSLDDLPLLPPHMSIARGIIEQLREKASKQSPAV